jgi:uncharacterized membrane protein YfcA
MHSPEYVAIVAGVIFVLAGFVKGTIGMGLPTVAMALLAQAMPPAQAAGLLLVPSLATNVWQAVAGRNLGALARRLRPAMIGIGLGTGAGAAFLPRDEALASLTLGIVLVAYAVLSLARVDVAVPRVWERRLSAAIGAVTGVITAETGVFVVPAVPYLAALGLARDELMQALGLCFTAATLALGASLFFEGELHRSEALGSSLALLPTFLGMLLGQGLRSRIAPRTFRLCFFLGLLLLGLHQVARALNTLS